MEGVNEVFVINKRNFEKIPNGRVWLRRAEELQKIVEMYVDDAYIVIQKPSKEAELVEEILKGGRD